MTADRFREGPCSIREADEDDSQRFPEPPSRAADATNGGSGHSGASEGENGREKRAARYAAAIESAPDAPDPETEGWRGWISEARAVMAVADEEQAALVAERDSLVALLSESTEDFWQERSDQWMRRAEAAEDVVARVVALAEGWWSEAEYGEDQAFGRIIARVLRSCADGIHESIGGCCSACRGTGHPHPRAHDADAALSVPSRACPECSGSGMLTTKHFDEHPAEVHICDYCSGTGVVLAPSDAGEAASPARDRCSANCGWECEHEPVEHPDSTEEGR